MNVGLTMFRLLLAKSLALSCDEISCDEISCDEISCVQIHFNRDLL